MYELFSIVSLNKTMYNKNGFTPELDGDKPRLLIVQQMPAWNCYKVKYPNGKTFNIHEDVIIPRSVFTPDHISYSRIAKEVRAVELEFKINPKFRDYLEKRLPQLALDVSQSIAAKEHHKQHLRELDKQTEPVKEVDTPVPNDRVYDVLLEIREALWLILGALVDE